MDLNFLVFAFPAGVAPCFSELRDEHVFVIIYAAVGTCFAGTMVRLMLTLTPCVCVAAAMCVSQVLDIYIYPARPAVAPRKRGVYGIDSRLAVILNTFGMLSLFILLHLGNLKRLLLSFRRSGFP
jgi:dolichyl-diphosphooligosaccharide---protein glycosyltransferase